MEKAATGATRARLLGSHDPTFPRPRKRPPTWRRMGVASAVTVGQGGREIEGDIARENALNRVIRPGDAKGG